MRHAHRRPDDLASWRIDAEWRWWFPLAMAAIVALPFLLHDLLT